MRLSGVGSIAFPTVSCTQRHLSFAFNYSNGLSRRTAISISPQLMTDAEIDSFNVQLRKDLDAVCQRAKADLRSAR